MGIDTDREQFFGGHHDAGAAGGEPDGTLHVIAEEGVVAHLAFVQRPPLRFVIAMAVPVAGAGEFVGVADALAGQAVPRLPAHAQAVRQVADGGEHLHGGVGGGAAQRHAAMVAVFRHDAGDVVPSVPALEGARGAVAIALAVAALQHQPVADIQAQHEGGGVYFTAIIDTIGGTHANPVSCTRIV
ncbi:MAG: hypothetical protein BWY76_03305 [bacterium ADurb.Bin429]|nr:MAG: hypothetical protein BWY76_03305 [bacterium ADurb.Bin429]